MQFITTVSHEKCANVEKSHEGKRLVEDAGYITIKKQLEMLMDAGERLADMRLKNYDYTDDVDIDTAFCPVSRSPNFDLVDAQHEYDNALARIAEAKKNASQINKEAPQTNETAQSDPKDQSDDKTQE